MFISLNIKANEENSFTVNCKNLFSNESSVVNKIDDNNYNWIISECKFLHVIPFVLKTNFSFSSYCFSDQQISSDIYIICQAAGDGNLEQVNQRYKAKPNALFLLNTDINPIESINNFLENKACNNLHLYITFSGNDIMMNDFRLSLKNIKNYKTDLKKWKNNVSGNIIIHNLSIAERAEIPMIISEIENITGLKIEILRTY
jgi:hypothetical protein